MRTSYTSFQTTCNASLTIACLRLESVLIFLATLCAVRPLETTQLLILQLIILDVSTSTPGIILKTILRLL